MHDNLCDPRESEPPPPLSVTVTRADNGYIIETEDALAVCEISETADALGDCNAAMSMLYTVLEAFGEVGSKHDSHRVRVRVIAHDTGEGA